MLVVRGLTNPQTTRSLTITFETVKSHIRSIPAKYNLHSKAELRQALGGRDCAACQEYESSDKSLAATS